MTDLDVQQIPEERGRSSTIPSTKKKLNKGSAISEESVIYPQPPRMSIGIKITTIALLGLFQLILVIVKMRGEGSGSWGTWLIPTWLIHALFAFYFVFHVVKKGGTSDYETVPTTTVAAVQESRSRKFLSYGWKIMFWIASLIFFIVLAVHLDSSIDGSLSLKQGEALVFVWIAYLAAVLFLILCYGINKWFCRS